MRVLNQAENQDEMADLIRSTHEKKSFLILWQVIDGKRSIHPIYIHDSSDLASGFEVISAREGELALTSDVVFFFCKSKNFIFKSQLNSQNENMATIELPQEIKLLEESEQESMGDLIDVFNEEKIFVDGLGLGNQTYDERKVTGHGEANINRDKYMVGRGDVDKLATKRSDFHQTEKLSTKWAVKSMSAADTALFEEELSYITLEEEDKQFEGMRSAPRAKPPEGKMVTVQELNDIRPKGTYPLYDLSRGGFAFLVFSKDEFNAGETVKILAFDTKKFDEPMLAIVKSVREADQMGIQYKVGCQFDQE